MPSVRTLAGELGINPNTIQKAYAELERQEIIKSVAGKGSIIVASAETVTDMNKEKLLAVVETCARDAAAAGVSYEEFMLAARKVFNVAGDKE